MWFLYVDESGDPGAWDPTVTQGSSPHYALSAIALPADEWRTYLDALVQMRRGIKEKFGLRLRDELHAAELINPRGKSDLLKIRGGRHGRVQLYRDALSGAVAGMPKARIFNIWCDKSKRTLTSDLEHECWKRLLERFQTFLCVNADRSQGIVFADETNEVKLRRLVRQLRVFNMVPSHFGGTRAVPLDRIVEDPVMRNSRDSYFVQVADLVVHALYRSEIVKGGFRKYGVDRLFDVVEPLLHKAASSRDPRKCGIVRLDP